MVRVLLAATHPNSSNGYSKIAYELAKYLSTKSDIELTYFGFQNFQKNPQHEKARELPSNIQVYDAFANEKNKQLGFGFDEIGEFVTMNKPDLVIIYNDMVVVSNIIDKLNKIENKKFKIAVYMDQVYLCQKKEHIKILNDNADFVICFSKYWEQIAKEQGITKPTGVLEHGYSPMLHYPVPKKLARMFFNLKMDDFIIINANRNQPRKRLDLMMMAFAEVVSRHTAEPIKLLIATAPTGAWNLIEIYERELRIRGLTLEEGMKHIIFIDNPQALTDEDMNTLYNTSDIGINTCSGEGWGMCNQEPAGMGIPQIVPNIGGFRDFLDKDCAILIEPKIKLYTDMTIDGCPGCAEICDAMDFADAIDQYYADEDMRKLHGENARKKIINNYKWNDLGEKLYTYITTILGVEPQVIHKNKISIDEINLLSENLKTNINIDTIDDTVKESNEKTKVEQTKVEQTKVEPPIKKNDIKSRLQAKLAKRKAEANSVKKTKITVVSDSSDDDLDMDKEKLLKLQSKINKLLAK
jgi:glycosyltransferase involved in cell wall biosynthesis